MEKMRSRRVAWVTGATGGVGPAVIRALLDTGLSIVATARDASKLTRLQDETGAEERRWLSQPVDLADPVSAQNVVEVSKGRFGGIDILVEVAGGWRGGTSVAGTDIETLR
jgi:NADP-dependent 3-hydroxy acid dehydrogenase YdfG